MKLREGITHKIVVFDGRKRNDPEWRGKLRLKSRDKPIAGEWNAEYALDCAPEWHGVLTFNEFTSEIIVARQPPYENSSSFTARPWSDMDALNSAVWLQGNDIEVKLDTAHNAARLVAHKNTFHPVRQYLAGLRWDGVPRIDTWLTEYMGVVSGGAGYVSAVGSRWLMAGVARIMQPGVKVDNMLIIEGPQGIGKSSLLRALCRNPEWFSDQLDELGSKDSLMQLAGVWILELAELDALVRKESTAVKSFLSRTVDRFRPPYGRTTMRVPRQLVLAGTTNASGYLKDETGARRFWPVRATMCEVDRIIADRDQLWAEATMRYDAGKFPIYLETKELCEAAEAEQAARYQSDPWTNPVRTFIAEKEMTAIPEILEDCLGLHICRHGQAEQNRVARILISSGWERYRLRSGPKSGDWVYRRG